MFVVNFEALKLRFSFSIAMCVKFLFFVVAFYFSCFAVFSRFGLRSTQLLFVYFWFDDCEIFIITFFRSRIFLWKREKIN